MVITLYNPAKHYYPVANDTNIFVPVYRKNLKLIFSVTGNDATQNSHLLYCALSESKFLISDPCVPYGGN